MTNTRWKTAEKFQGDLQVIIGTQIPPNYEKLFCKATELIAPFVESKKITAFFVRDELRMKLIKPVYAEWFPNFLVYNVAKIEKITDERLLLVIFLEELVHAYYSSFDEDFVSKKVTEIYPEISYNSQNQQYEIRK